MSRHGINKFIKDYGFVIIRVPEPDDVKFSDVGLVTEFQGECFIKTKNIEKYKEGKNVSRYLNCPKELMDVVEKRDEKWYLVETYNTITKTTTDCIISSAQLKKYDLYSVLNLVKENNVQQLLLIYKGLEKYDSQNITEVLDDITEMLKNVS